MAGRSAKATILGDFPRIALGIAVMCLFVMAFNRFLWRPLYMLAAERIGDVDFVPRAAMLERACGVLEEMVGLLRKGMALETTKALNDKLQAIESEADRLILEMYRDTYTNETDPMRYLILKDLFEILEKAIDRCREAGVVAYEIVLKNS